MKWRNAISKHQNSLLGSNSHGTMWLKQEIWLTCVWLVEHFNIFCSWIWFLHNQYNSCSQTVLIQLRDGRECCSMKRFSVHFLMSLMSCSDTAYWPLLEWSLWVFCRATTIYLQCRADDGRRLFENVVEQFQEALQHKMADLPPSMPLFVQVDERSFWQGAYHHLY